MLTPRVEVTCTQPCFATMLAASGAFWTGEPAPTGPADSAGHTVEPMEVEAVRRFLPFPTGHGREPRSCYARVH